MAVQSGREKSETQSLCSLNNFFTSNARENLLIKQAGVENKPAKLASAIFQQTFVCGRSTLTDFKSLTSF